MAKTAPSSITTLCRKAREASHEALETKTKNTLLKAMAKALRAQQGAILTANRRDLTSPAGKKLNPAMKDRLLLNPERIEAMAKGLEEVASLPDPVGEMTKQYDRPNGLRVSKVRIPLGVIAIIYESRPNVTVDAAGLCLKSGNVAILRGGSEAFESNRKLVQILKSVLKKSGVSPDIIQFVDTPNRSAMEQLVKQTGLVDLAIPRGGEGLMRWMEEHSRVPVIKHDKGVCHVFVDGDADLHQALDITLNSKAHRPGVCNAAEALLVHERIASKFLPRMLHQFEEIGVEMRGDLKTLKILPTIKKATDKDWGKEFLDKIMAVKVVKSVDEAIHHIRQFGSNHTETIVTQNWKNADHFVRSLNSSAVMVNASTRFNDGGQLGLGAEIGISTSKLHAFGPMGLEELTTTKFVVEGEGHVRT